MKVLKRLLPFILIAAILSGCTQSGGTDAAGVSPGSSQPAGAPADQTPAAEETEDIFVDRVVMTGVETGNEAVALADSPAAVYDMLLPEASGTQVQQNERAVVDYSNAADGYVMVNFTDSTNTRIKVQTSGPTAGLTYTYNLAPGEWTTFPLSDGSGSYKVTVLENTQGTSYAQVLSASFTASLSDEFAPFLRPNQYVDYAAAPQTVAKAKELAQGKTDALELVTVVYNYVVNEFTYDKELAASVKSGYLPVLDNVLAAKKGICFDYAALMTGMLRSLGVPCKLVTGYVPLGNGQSGFHAWINVWSEETGWVDGAIYFDGSAWQRMDPTFASSGKSSDAIMSYIGNGTNYSEKYIY